MQGNRLGLTVNTVSEISDRFCPVTGGIPFPRGGLSSSDGIRLYDASGVEIPVQTEALATWDPEGKQVRWLLVDFQVRGLKAGKTPFTLVYGPEVSPGEKVGPVDPKQSSWPPERIIECLYMVDQDGRRYSAAIDGEESIIETEAVGPLRTAVRAHVWHVDGQGRRLCRAILRLHYYAGLDQVRVYHSFVMDADPEVYKIRGVGLEVPVAGGGRVLVSGEQDGGEVLSADGAVDLLQDRDDHYSVSGSVVREGRRSGTWLCVEGEEGVTGVFVRNGWEEYPKRLRWDGRSLDVQLWPTEGCPVLDLSFAPSPIIHYTRKVEGYHKIGKGTPTHPNVEVFTEEELREAIAKHPNASVCFYRYVSSGQTDWTTDSVAPLMEEAKKLEAEMLLPERFAYYYIVFGKNGQGTMKPHELVLTKLSSDAKDRGLTSLAATVRFPAVVCASPEWNCSTGAFGPGIPYGGSEFAEVDRAMTCGELEDIEKFTEDLHLYGARDFGDYINGNPAMAGPLYKVYGADAKVRITDRIGWMNNESHDSTIGGWLQFLRTGDPRIFYRAEAACEHLATVDHRHAFPTPDRHLAITLYHTINHYDGGDCPSHTLSGSYLLGYYITGDRALREVAVANADFFAEAQGRDGTGWYAGPSPSRQNSAPMTCILNAYTLTWDKKYLESLDRFLAVWAPIYDVTDPRHYLGGTLPYPGAEFLRLVDHKPFKEAFHKMMDDLRTKMRIDNQSDYYMPGMVYMWEATGDPSYLTYCWFVFQCYADNLKRLGQADRVRRRIFGLPDANYGMVSGHLSVGLAGIAEARRQGIDIEAAVGALKADRAKALGAESEGDALYYHSTVEGTESKWYLPESPERRR